MHSLQAQHARKVRVVHFGDSHIASDNETAVVRSDLQSMFGDGGPGLSLPWGGPRQPTLNIAYGNTWGWQRFHPTYSSPVEDTGLALTYVEATSPSQRAWVEASGSEFRVDYLSQPGGGEAEFLIDGALVGRRSMLSSAPQVQVVRFQAAEANSRHRFEIRTLNSGRVRLLGVSVEKDAPGVVYSALGLVGARAEYLLKCREDVFESQVAAEQPDLVIMGYGTNETSGSYFDESAYDAALTSIIARIRRAAPSALVVFLTPPDRGDISPTQSQKFERFLQAIIRVERNVAERDGAVLVDLYNAMGGPGSAERWATMHPALARPDMTHFTNQGYDLLGRYIVGGIMKLYEAGPDALGSAEQAGFAGAEHHGTLLPPLYPVLTASAAVPSAQAPYLSDAYTPLAPIYYFLRADGQVIVTNDLGTMDTHNGRIITAEEAGCLLRGKAAPCDNTGRW